MAMAALDELYDGDRFLLSLVRKHRTKRAVTDDSNMWDLGSVFLVDNQALALVDLKANVLQPEPFSVRSSTNGG